MAAGACEAAAGAREAARGAEGGRRMSHVTCHIFGFQFCEAERLRYILYYNIIYILLIN